MRMWLRRAELDAMLTRELQKIAGCVGATLMAGAPIPVADFDLSNWADFTVTPAPGFDPTLCGLLRAALFLPCGSFTT